MRIPSPADNISWHDLFTALLVLSQAYHTMNKAVDAMPGPHARDTLYTLY